MGKKGLFIVFEGTDGSGKTTIIENLPSALSEYYTKDKILYYHWRPGFIKSPNKKSNENTGIICTEPHKYKPYNKVISAGKFLFFNMDFILGYWFMIRKRIKEENLVVFDRYYYDYYLDKLRYRLDIGNWLINFCKPFIPKPDITFLLIGDAQILYERKKEIPITEIQAQTDRLIRNQRQFNNSVVVNVNKSIEDIVNIVTKNIINLSN